MDQALSHALIFRGERLAVPLGDVTVGRSRTSDLTISDPSISRRHAVLRAGDGHIVVRDLGSSNGTFINNRKVIAEDVVEDGDLLRFGDAETQVSIPGAEPAAPPQTVLPNQPGEATFFLQAESLNLGGPESA
ncbi:MAG: FHA domain-containing protein, partial [Acidobacteriota bacterium]